MPRTAGPLRPPVWGLMGVGGAADTSSVSSLQLLCTVLQLLLLCTVLPSVSMLE